MKMNSENNMKVRPTSTKSTFSRKNSNSNNSKNSHGTPIKGKDLKIRLKDDQSVEEFAFTDDDTTPVSLGNDSLNLAHAINSDFDLRKQYEDAILLILNDCSR